MPQGQKRKGRKPANSVTTEKLGEKAPDGAVITLASEGDRETFNFQTLGQTKPRELPTLLRQAASALERQLGA